MRRHMQCRCGALKINGNENDYFLQVSLELNSMLICRKLCCLRTDVERIDEENLRITLTIIHHPSIHP
jgi:hypothetical protein